MAYVLFVSVLAYIHTFAMYHQTKDVDVQSTTKMVRWQVLALNATHMSTLNTWQVYQLLNSNYCCTTRNGGGGGLSHTKRTVN